MSNEFICVAIDGTNSRGVDYSGGASSDLQLCFNNTSHVRSFFEKFDVPSNRKLFLHGPGITVERKDGMSTGEAFDAATGVTCEKIANDAMKWLKTALSIWPDAKVVLVGHSRGGHIATDLAIRLANTTTVQKLDTPNNLLQSAPIMMMRAAKSTIPISPLMVLDYALNRQVNKNAIPVYFLGLYDAVDMTKALGDTSTIPENVEWAYHAMRSEKYGSRSSWGNAAKPKPKNPKLHFFQEFDGTHGAMGGAFPTECGGSGLYGSCDIQLSAAQNKLAGLAAHKFVMDGAKSAGLPGFTK